MWRGLCGWVVCIELAGCSSSSVCCSFQRSQALDGADGIDNFDILVQDLEGNIAADIHQARDKANDERTLSSDDDGSDKQQDSLVRKAIDGLKILAKGGLGHPTGRGDANVYSFLDSVLIFGA